MAATLVIYIFIVGCCLQVDLIPPCFNWFAPYPSPISCPSSHTIFKIIHSLINTLLHVILLNFDEKTPSCHAHIRSKKLNFCKNYPILWAKKVNRMPFFSDLSRKNQCSHGHFLSKNRPFCEKLIGLMPIFCQKNVHSLKTQCSHVFF